MADGRISISVPKESRGLVISWARVNKCVSDVAKFTLEDVVAQSTLGRLNSEDPSRDVAKERLFSDHEEAGKNSIARQLSLAFAMR